MIVYNLCKTRPKF